MEFAGFLLMAAGCFVVVTADDLTDRAMGVLIVMGGAASTVLEWI